MNVDFINSISVEENPFENEVADEVIIYNLDGNECDDEE